MIVPHTTDWRLPRCYEALPGLLNSPATAPPYSAATPMASVPVARDARSSATLEVKCVSQMCGALLLVMMATLPPSQCVALQRSNANWRAAGRYPCDAYQRPNATSRAAGAYHLHPHTPGTLRCYITTDFSALLSTVQVITYRWPRFDVGILQPRVVEHCFLQMGTLVST